MKIPAMKKTYRGQVVLDLPELEIPQGSMIAVCGENGNGKSTFGKILAGIIKDDNKNIFAPELKVGYMTQRAFAFRLSVRRNLMLNADASFSKEENIKRAEELMKAMGIQDAADKNAAKLSVGQTQRMALARLLMKKYDVIILDEPTASLDTETTLKAEQLILEYHKQTGCTVFLITHQREQAERICDSVWCFTDGKLI